MTQTSTVEKNKTVSIKRNFNAPVKNLWAAWAEPEKFKKWCSPETYTNPDCSIDFKVGGKNLFSMQAPDGKKTWSTSTYKEIVPLKKIVYTDSFSDSKGNAVPASTYNMPGEWDMELTVTVEFEEVNGKTTMSLQHIGIPSEMYEDCIKGWQSCFDKLEKSL